MKGLTAGDPAANALNIVLNFEDEETGIEETTNLKSQTLDSTTWYTIDGRCLNGKPSAKGIYINRGKKIFIK